VADPYSIRAVEPADLAFVIETTCQIRMPKDDYGRPRLLWADWRYAYGHLVEAKWLGEGSCYVVDAGDGVLLGYAIEWDHQITCVAVKAAFRGNHLGRQLLKACGTEAPYCPNDSWRAWQRTWGKS
jgi:ribosomal protein S18 acetylase RimI-like enzyme